MTQNLVMKTSALGLKKLEVREGKINKAYRDIKNIWTIGVGHTGPEVTGGLVWSEEQITSALAKDVVKCENAINLYCCTALTQYQFDALVSFIFNVGVSAFSRSTLLRKLNQGDIDGAVKEFDRWHIPADIIGRRNSEREQFCGR